MKFLPLAGVLFFLSFNGSLCAESDTPEMAEARVMGVTVAQLMLEKLVDLSGSDFPGIHDWVLKEGKVFNNLNKEKPDDSWRKLNSRKLVQHNASFWQMYYEIVPGDPGLAMLHAGALLAAGDADRAQTILRMTLHRGDLDETTRNILISIMRHCHAFMVPSHALVRKGVELHDKSDFAGALLQYDAALRLWPLNGWAAYERGITLRMQEKKNPDSQEVRQAFELSREFQPFQFNAWQGSIKEIPGMEEMLTQMPKLWNPSLKDLSYVMKPEALHQMSGILQLAEVDDLALVVRQICIIRRGRYSPEDHPFISKSLRRLAPGPQAEATITKLSGANMLTTQLYNAPVKGIAR
jgi:tetratricopeptide (TPR) repeat protein